MTQKIDQLKKAIAELPASAGTELRMEKLLDPALAALPDLLKNRENWRSLYIDYEPPFLMRISLPVSSGDRTAFLSLHYFFGLPAEHPSDKAGLENPYKDKPELQQVESVNNYHPHPWASSFQILRGSYKQQVGLAKEAGYSDDPASPLRPIPFAVWEQDANDTAKNRYHFNDPLLWHRVLPNDGQPVASIMITYIPENWNQTGPRPAQKQRELNETEKDFMFNYFTEILSPKTAPKPQVKQPKP